MAKLFGLVGVVLALGVLPWAAHARNEPFGSASKLFWAVPVVLMVCKVWAAALIARALLAYAEHGNRRARVAALRRGRWVSERAGQATGHDDTSQSRLSSDRPMVEDHSQ